MAAFKVGKTFLQNPLRKHRTAFVKVVEGSEIYNFPIHHLVHFSSNFGSKSGSNSPAPQHVTLERDVATRQSARRAPAHAVTRQGSPLGVRAHGPRPEAAPSLDHAHTEAIRIPCPP
jgi:hypothetical protein